MGSKIYTRQGDHGQTALADGRRVPKDAPRVEAYGTVDEANAWIGLAASETDDPALAEALSFVQHRLFNCSSNLATPPGAPFQPTRVAEQDITWLEQAIDRFEQRTGPVTAFVLSGGTRAAGLLHVARTVCRRAERRLVSLAEVEEADPLVLTFINRCSDFLFAAARYANAVQNRPDVHWDKDLAPPA